MTTIVSYSLAYVKGINDIVPKKSTMVALLIRQHLQTEGTAGIGVREPIAPYGSGETSEAQSTARRGVPITPNGKHGKRKA